MYPNDQSDDVLTEWHPHPQKRGVEQAMGLMGFYDNFELKAQAKVRRHHSTSDQSVYVYRVWLELM
ncbi:hypothetical protein D3C80_1909140 [compost metagenome]